MICAICLATLMLSARAQGLQSSSGQSPQESSSQSSTTEAPIIPSKFLTEVLAKYSKAKSLVGTIVLTVSAKDKSQVTTTKFQYERPDKLYIYQTRPDPDAGTWIITSDGKLFSYPTPKINARFQGQRMVEEVHPKGHPQLNVKLMYGVTSQILPDFSAPLSIAISWNDELNRILHRWLSVKYLGEAVIDGQKVYRIGGDYSELYAPPPTGTYEIDITPDGDIKQYEIKEYYGVPKSSGIQAAPVLLTQIWKCDLQVNGKPDESLFQVLLSK